MDADMKSLLYNGRTQAITNRTNKAIVAGTYIGAAISVPTALVTGIPAIVPILTIGGTMIGISLATALNKTAFPDDRSAYGTSSVIIFDREGSLDVIRTKEIKKRD